MRQGPTRVLIVMALLGAAPAVAIARQGGDDKGLPDGMLGSRVAPLLLLTRPDVQADLGLTPEQVESAGKTLAELRAQGLQIRGQKNTPEVVARRRAIDEVQWQWIAAQLTEAQRERLNQIDLQWEGPAALIRPSVVDLLAMDDAQRGRLQRLIAAEQARPDRGRPGAQAALFQKLVAELTPDQWARWKVMLGPSFPAGMTARTKETGADANLRRASGTR